MKHETTTTALVVVVLAVVLGTAARAGPPRPWRILPAMAAVQAGTTLALYTPDLRSVLGVGPDGARRWRLATGDQGGLRDLDVLPDGAGADNVLAYAGSEAIVVAPDSGKVLGRRADVRLGSPGGPRGCRVAHEDGVCALACECSFAVVSCTTLATLGEAARLPYFEEHAEDGTPMSHCPMFSGALLGRSGDTLVTSFPAATDKPFFSVPEIVIARHARTGAELWRSSEIGFFDEALSGVVGDVCFAGSRAGSLTVFDCQRGTTLWRHAAATPKGGVPQVEATPHGLVVRDGVRVALHEPRNGQARWQVEVPSSSIVLLAGAAPQAGVVIDSRFPKSVRGARILDPQSGATLGEIPFGEAAERWPRRFAGGWLTLGAKRVDAWDDSGKSLGGIGSSHDFSDFAVGDGPRVAAWDENGVTITDIGRDRSVSVVDGPGARVVGLEGRLGAGLVAVMQDGRGPWDPKDPATFGELRLYRLEP